MFHLLHQIGTGFKDEDLETHTTFFKDHIIDKPKSYYKWDKSVECDHWFEPVQVWEIKAADLSVSPVHKAAAGMVGGLYRLITIMSLNDSSGGELKRTQSFLQRLAKQ